ncbi:MAG: ATP-binding protein [Planctomycetota bacterium]|jgi:signal transduction histidine kinase/ActR/RegA family two-component response regulator
MANPAEEDLGERIALLESTINTINLVLRETLTYESVEQVAQACLSAAEKLTGSAFGFICEVNSRGCFDTIAISDTGWSACRVRGGRELLMAKDLELQGIRGRVIQEGRSIIFNNPASEPDWIEPPEGHPALHCFMGVPFRFREDALGMIGLANKEGGFKHHDQQVVEAVTGAVSEALLHKRAEEKVRETTAQLNQAQKMEAVGRLAGGIAHDFNNHLTVISGYGAILEGRLIKGGRDANEVSEILHAADRAAALIRQLLAFSRRQVMRPKILDLNAVVRTMKSMLRRLIGEDIDLRFVEDPLVGRIQADQAQLEQIVMNLAVNARDAMPKGGHITIETAGVHLDEEYSSEHVDVTPGDYVRLTVSDTGTGMGEDTRTRIFEPFFTTKAKKGTGLGLATVYGIVKQSGAHIWVYSEPGVGTTFKIYFPRAEGSVKEPIQIDTRERSIAGQKTILLCEDDDGVRDLTRRILESFGYSVLVAASMAEAMEKCEAHDGEIDLLLTDVVMPGGSGVELAEGIGRQRPDTLSLFMSGYTDDAIVHHGVLEDGIPFLEKPFTPAQLGKAIQDVLFGPNAPAI